MDIEVIIKKTLVFAGLFGMVAATATVITTIAQSVVGEFIHVGARVQMVITGLFILALYQPTHSLLVRLTDRFLFQKKQDIRITLNKLAEEIISVLDMREIGDRVMLTLEEAFRTESAALLVRGEETANFKVVHSQGLENITNEVTASSPFINYFTSFDKTLNLENESEKAGLAQEIVATCAQLKTALAIPLFHQGKLTGILNLGKKKSDQEYTQEEIQYFPTLASQVAVAISNAQLLKQIVQEQTEKKQVQAIADRVNYTRSFKHEGGNKLVGVIDSAILLQMLLKREYAKYFQRISEKLSDGERKAHDRLVQHIEKHVHTIQRNAERLELIINTVVGALSANESTMQDFDFRIAWETAKRNMEMDRDYRFVVETDEPLKIYGNICLLERVFENFLGNSRDAIKDIEKPLIYLTGQLREHEGKKVIWFEYWDSGPGVPDELFEKVFQQDFSTKPKPKSSTSLEAGHGQGLYVCKKTIEEFHKGKMWLEKGKDSRSRFVFWLPAKVEVNEK